MDTSPYLVEVRAKYPQKIHESHSNNTQSSKHEERRRCSLVRQTTFKIVIADENFDHRKKLSQ